MPYLNNLASQYSLEMETVNDGFSGEIADDKVVRELVKAGKFWKAYFEALPSAGYLGGDNGPYSVTSVTERSQEPQ